MNVSKGREITLVKSSLPLDAAGLEVTSRPSRLVTLLRAETDFALGYSLKPLKPGDIAPTDPSEKHAAGNYRLTLTRMRDSDPRNPDAVETFTEEEMLYTIAALTYAISEPWEYETKMPEKNLQQLLDKLNTFHEFAQQVLKK